MRILLILDGSAPAMEVALRLARERGAELCALFVQDDGWRGFTGNDWLSTSKSYTGFLEYVEGLEHDEARRAVEQFQRRASALGLEPRVKLARGSLSRQTLAELGQGYDLLVMPQPLRRGLESNQGAARKIIESAPCSLYLVKSPEASPADPA
jgi:nucleotide-binding universal stress UspA family protein